MWHDLFHILHICTTFCSTFLCGQIAISHDIVQFLLLFLRVTAAFIKYLMLYMSLLLFFESKSIETKDKGVLYILLFALILLWHHELFLVVPPLFLQLASSSGCFYYYSKCSCFPNLVGVVAVFNIVQICGDVSVGAYNVSDRSREVLVLNVTKFISSIHVTRWLIFLHVIFVYLFNCVIMFYW